MSNMFRRLILPVIVVGLAACQSTLRQDIELTLTNPDQTGIRWGVVVADMDGAELLAMRPDDRFTPASNTKIFTTMATYHHLETLSRPELNPGTRVVIEPGGEGEAPDLILYGGGDAMLADRADCEQYCLAALADQVADLGLEEVGQVYGDDSFFPHERWGVGWSLEDLQYYYGTAMSALSVNDNLVWIEIMPGPTVGSPASVTWRAGDAFYALNPELLTSDDEADRAIRVERHPGDRTIRIHGSIPISTEPLNFALAIDHPAEFTALRFKHLLEERGIRVAAAGSRHRPRELSDEPMDEDEVRLASFLYAPALIPEESALALPASPLTESLRRISKDSENLHAEIALRRLGRLDGTGSRAFGVAAIETFLAEAGLPSHGYALHGGSGMSIYNRVSPRSMVQLLAFAARQSWWEAWLADQPIGGVDGSLKRRFIGTPLEGKIFAKTGTLNGANALSGVMIAASGRQLLFSIIANDRPSQASSAIVEMDAALNLIAASY